MKFTSQFTTYWGIGMTVVIFSRGIVVFVKFLSELDSFPMVALISEVAGVSAFVFDTLVDPPIIEENTISVLTNKIKFIHTSLLVCARLVGSYYE